MDETAKLIQELSDAALGRREPPLLVPPVDRGAVDIELRVIAEHGALDAMPNPPGSMRALKRAVLRLGAFNWARQRAVNHSIGKSIEAVLAELDELRALTTQTERRTAVAAAASDSAASELRRHLDLELRAFAHRIDDSAADLGAAVLGLEQSKAAIAALRTELAALTTRLVAEQRHTAALRNEVARLRLGVPPAPDADVPAHSHDVAELYARFEAAFRPSDDELESRFSDYVEVLAELRGGRHPVIDIGAGRGEFIEVLSHHGIAARGVDLNPDAVDEAKHHGRAVEHGDAVTYLRALDSESVGAITAFHVVEHLDPATLLHILDESLRVLRPGGILVIETPNPTNVTVGAAAFYQDPTHLRPVVPAYLEFVLRDRGFAEVTTRFLHPLPEFELELGSPDQLGGTATAQLLDHVKWALKGPQDYAAIARRAATS